MEWVQQSTIPWSFDPRCTKCGERMALCQRSEDLPTMHTDCYAIEDMDRFREWAPGTRPINVRRLRCGWGIPGDPKRLMDAYHAYQKLNREG
jgi:hypothetical protein